MSMKYIKNMIESHNPTRMDTLNDLTIDQFCALPNNTEIVIIDIAQFGMGLRVMMMVATEETRNDLLDAARQDGVPGSASLPGSVFITLLPDVLDLDMDTLLNEKFRSAGHRHGKEGAPMFSEEGLRARFTDTWHDTAYQAYVESYKKAAESRRKGR